MRKSSGFIPMRLRLLCHGVRRGGVSGQPKRLMAPSRKTFRETVLRIEQVNQCVSLILLWVVSDNVWNAK